MSMLFPAVIIGGLALFSVVIMMSAIIVAARNDSDNDAPLHPPKKEYH